MAPSEPRAGLIGRLAWSALSPKTNRTARMGGIR
jgi:hypothetical protein